MMNTRSDRHESEHKTPFNPVGKADFPALERETLKFWEKEKIFERSLEQRADAPNYLFYDGPPFATGLPHFGHFVPGTIKDLIPRYQTMKGKRVERRFGWDCHGLPVEYEIEKQLGISGREQIENYGVGRFNDACRSIVLRYTSEWRSTVTRMGRWVDFDNEYKTMDLSYMESIWWVFKRLWDTQLIYFGHYILPYSPGLTTPLSNFEVNLGGYRDVHDPAITVRFRLRGNKKLEACGIRPDTPLFAWTTTPWTLPSNLGVAVGKDIDYVLVDNGDEQCILALSRLPHYYPDTKSFKILKRYKGSDLEGLEYYPLFSYFSDYYDEGAFRVHLGDFVSIEEGTGIVHLAPGFGEDDYRTLGPTGLPVLVPIDADCRFTSEVPDFAGLFVKDADSPIIRKLKDEGKLVKRENYLHSYPFCYRTGKPLIYRAISSWFVNIQKIKQKMIDANGTIEWSPKHLKYGRFGKWLENARDWAISRNRYWGNPIPIWKCDGSDHIECIGSLAELEEKSGKRLDDIHKQFVDDITWPSPDGQGTMRRVSEVLDCWFESGAMPYAYNHYPFESSEEFERNFPADFICEGLDQTRGWFYTLTVLAAALFDKPAFQNVICSGLVLADDGRKMSKSARNYTDPTEILEQYGADALRLFLLHSSVVRGEDLRYSDEGTRGMVKDVLIPLWNAYMFFVTYANIDMIDPEPPSYDMNNSLDCWLLSVVESMTEKTDEMLSSYDVQRAIDPILECIDMLNNWYIRRSRRRFWRSVNDTDKKEAYQTLRAALLRLVTVAAPIIPFISEVIYRNMRYEGSPLSVHLCDFPTVDRRRRDEDLEYTMALCRRAVRIAHLIRRSYNIKARQPLRTLYLVTKDEREHAVLTKMEDIILEEVNVKQIVYWEDEQEVVTYRAKPNFPVLGKVLGKRMKQASQAIQKLDSDMVAALISGKTLTIDIDGEPFELSHESILVQRDEREGLRIHNEGSLTVALDAEIDEELRHEGIARDIVRAVQNMRKTRGFQITDRILLHVAGDENIRKALTAFRQYVMAEVLAVELTMAQEKGAHSLMVDSIDEDSPVWIAIELSNDG